LEKKTHCDWVSFTLIFLTGFLAQNEANSNCLEGFQKSKEKRSFNLTLGKGSEVAVRVSNDQ